MAGKKTSKHQQDLYKSYQTTDRYAKNRIAKLKRHVAKFPEDEVGAEALKKALKNGVSYRRKKPHNKVWSSGKKRYAQVLASMGYNGNIALRVQTFKQSGE